ncbi:MAG: DUF3592 domain-containing protein [Chthoniobacteraceae bacterium]
MKLPLLIDFSNCGIVVAKTGPSSTGEKILSCLMLLFFGLIGLGLLYAALKELLKVRRRRPFLIKLPGTVLSVSTERDTRAGSVNNRDETAVVIRFIPFVAFTTPEGKRVDFRSEVCDIHHLRRRLDGSLPEVESSWRSGQSVDVFYDPGAVLKPFIGGGPGPSFIAWGMLAAGLLTFGVAVGMSFVFYAKTFR